MEQNTQLKELCKDCLLHGRNIQTTPRANVVCNHNKRNTELLYFVDEFSTVGNRSTAPRQRLFCYDPTYDAIRAVDPGNKKATISNLMRNRHKNQKRALNSFLGYGQNNDWQYFFTITFDPKKIDSSNQVSVKYAWKLFRQKIQYRYPDCQIMCVVEYHKDNNKLHFHGVIARANLNAVLCRAVNLQPFRKDKQGNVIMRNGQPVHNGLYLQPLLSNIGDKIYNFNSNFYTDGFCSVIPLTDRTNDLTVYEKVVFYLAKYMAKDKSAVPYNGKSFFCTRNLEKGKKECFYLSEEEFRELVAFEGFTLKKSNSRFSSYISRTSRTEFVSKICRAWTRTMSDGLTCTDIINELDSILYYDDELDPLFAEEN